METAGRMLIIVGLVVGLALSLTPIQFQVSLVGDINCGPAVLAVFARPTAAVDEKATADRFDAGIATQCRWNATWELVRAAAVAIAACVGGAIAVVFFKPKHPAGVP